MSVALTIVVLVGTHYFVDETKAKAYVVVAVACPDASLATARRTLGALVLPGQRSIHMKHESERRRRQIADAICSLRKVGVSGVVIDAGRGPDSERVRRDRALRALVQRLSPHSAASLVLDLDQTLVAQDARTLTTALAQMGATAITYSHQRLATEQLLALPDVIAWSWARGGEWRRRVESIVDATISV